jgi:hypoxanthine-DNA glycosylase
MSDKPLSYSFPPLVGKASKILLLGSMPGLASLEAEQYYAHPRNAFWPIMAELFDVDKDAPYEQRCLQLTEAGIAVWDVLKACHRPGSLDQHIDPNTIKANDFAGFLTKHSGIAAIFFNGGKAEQVFRSAVLTDLSYVPALEKLPSTSPAHAAMSFQQKLAAWQRIKVYC